MKIIRKFVLDVLRVIPVALTFSSCGGRSDDDNWVQKSTTVQSIDTINLSALSASTTTTLTDTAKFSTHISSSILNNLILGEFQNSNYGIGIFGINSLASSLGKTVKITNLNLTVGGTTYSIGSCNSDSTGTLVPDAYESSDTYLIFVKAYFNAINSGSGNQATLTILLSTNSDILKTNQVSLRIKYYAKYSYKYYSN